MPSAKSDDLLQKTLWKALLPPLLAVGLLLYLLVYQLNQMRTAAEEVRRTDRVLAQADRTLHLIIDMDAGQRGYLIGGNKDFLKPYEAGRQKIDNEFKVLTDLIRTPEGRKNLLVVQQLSASWLQSATRDIALHQVGAVVAARDFNTGHSDALMRTVRQRFDQLIRQQETLREKRTQEVEQVTRWLFTVGAGASVAIGALLAASTLYQLRSLSDHYRKLVHGERDAREYMTTTLQSIGDAVLVTDNRGRVTLMNRAAQTLTGWQLGEALNREHGEVCTVRDEADVPRKSPVHTVLQEPQMASPVQQGVLLRRDGQQVPIEEGAAPIRDGAGDLRGVVLVFRDVTERKAKEAALIALGEKDHRIAETLQRSMLITPAENTFPGLTVTTHYEAAWEEALVGGDFHDTFAVSETQAALIVGDVTGKGLEAAVYTAEIKFVLRAFLRENPDPADALGRLNRYLLEAERRGDRVTTAAQDMTPEAMNIRTVCVAITLMDTTTGATVYAAAGAEPPLVYQSATGQVLEMPTGGMIAGISSVSDYVNHRLQLAAGDLLIVTTDGITEARNDKRQFFGPEGITETVTEYMARTPRTTANQELLDALAEHVAHCAQTYAGGKLRDDLCLLIAARTDFTLSKTQNKLPVKLTDKWV